MGEEGSCLEQQGLGQHNTHRPACLHGSASTREASEASSPARPQGASGSRIKSPSFSKDLLPAFCPASLLLRLMEGTCPWVPFCLGAEEGEHLREGFWAEGLLLGITVCLNRTGQVRLRSHRVHPSVPVVVAHPAIAVPQNRGDALGETARLCGEEI